MGLRCLFTLFVLQTALQAQQLDAHSLQTSLNRGLHRSSASAVVVAVNSGKPLASYRLAAAPPREPGSTLKPLFAAVAIKSGTVTARTEVACPGILTIGQHNLRCSHPRAITIFDLQHAIAYSCNSWFAQLAAHMSAGQLDDGLRSYGLTVTRTPATLEQRQLLVLGLEDIRVTPMQLAEAYRTLALQLSGNQLAPVQAGLLDSVNYGMAHNAAVPGVTLAGKTGTASNPGSSATHGLFVGILYSPATRKPAAIIVVVVPQGNGADAAALAQRCLLRWSGR
jgi:cell division protein FtsI/penicillin-binding protein 2